MKPPPPATSTSTSPMSTLFGPAGSNPAKG
jgi:hypothetical protein